MKKYFVVVVMAIAPKGVALQRADPAVSPLAKDLCRLITKAEVNRTSPYRSTVTALRWRNWRSMRF